MNERYTLAGALIRQALAVSRSVAKLLDGAERLLVNGFELEGAVGRDPQRTTESELLSAAGNDWQGEFRSALETISGKPAGEGEQLVSSRSSGEAQRLARLLLQSWAAEGGRARRPDVLALTSQILANPAVPNTLDLSRFAVVLALRAVYAVRYGVSSLEELRRAYDDLQNRFSKQQARRQRHDAGKHESLILDVLSMHGRIHRSLTRETARAYRASFQQYPFGVHPARRRDFGEGPWPQLDGALPDFPDFLNLAFNQPMGVPGFDEITQGLVPTVPAPGGRSWEGGLVTLIAGPPGSGKTSLCLSVASRMAELGSVVRYVATEEETHALHAKRIAVSDSLAEMFWPGSTPPNPPLGNWDVTSGRNFEDLGALTAVIRRDTLHEVDQPDNGEPEDEGSNVYLVFPRVVVIDSMTALLQGGQPGNAKASRRELGRMLSELRAMGVCVFLVGALQDCDDEGLAYLVDNVFILDSDAKASPRHPIRTITLRKTRIQSSSRGSHVFHLGAREGCSVSPSLHSVLRSLKGRPEVHAEPNRRAVLWSKAPSAPNQLSLPLPSPPVDLAGATPRAGDLTGPMTVQARSHVLIYGRGSSGKARLAMSIAFEPRHPLDDDWPAHLVSRGEHVPSAFDKDYSRTTRVLVLSFLYGREYYRNIARHLYRMRLGENREDVDQHLSVLDFYPGYIDPETLLARVRRQIRSATLEGCPFSAVILDGVHNLLVQFPLLEKEPLLWPTLFRLFRIEGLDTITTFTFFSASLIDRTNAAMLAGSEHIFFQLLVSNCDYTFLAERPADAPQRAGRNWVSVRLASSIDGFGREPPELWWDPASLVYRLPA